MWVKNILKTVYYGVNPAKFSPEITLKTGFVFHTEEIFNPEIFKTLVRFCREYTAITGTKCICVTMTPPNKRIEKGMRLFQCNNQEYVNRMLELSEVSHMGFHGHFWHDPDKFEDNDYCIRKDNDQYDYEVLYKQFTEQIEWFTENNVAHNNTYSGGWWFLNRDVIELLLKYGIKYDYSVSKSPNLWNPFTIEMTKKNKIKYGESFFTELNGKKLLHIQNLHCGHDTPFPYDATRFMNTLIEKDYPHLVGVVNSHDYCLDYEYTLNWMRYLRRLPCVEFLNHQNFVDITPPDTKIITI